MDEAPGASWNVTLVVCDVDLFPSLRCLSVCLYVIDVGGYDVT